MRFEAVIFDLDGVICFTDEYHYLAWKTVADEINVPFDRKVNNRLRGVSRMESLDIILEKYAGTPKADRLLMTPHVAWAPLETRQRLVTDVGKSIEAWLNGEKRSRVV